MLVFLEPTCFALPVEGKEAAPGEPPRTVQKFTIGAAKAIDFGGASASSPCGHTPRLNVGEPAGLVSLNDLIGPTNQPPDARTMTQKQNQLFKRSSLRIAAGLCLLGALASAHAALVVRTVNQTVNSANLFDVYALDVDLNGSTDFTFNASNIANFSSSAFITTDSTSSSAFVIDSINIGFPAVSRLLAGAGVSGTSLFSQPGSDQGDLATFNIVNVSSTGNFFGQTGFVGLRFVGGAGPLYGFAQITVDGDGTDNPYSVTIGQVGYEDSGSALQIPGGAAVPEPGSLALLAAAGIGFLASRRRRIGATA